MIKFRRLIPSATLAWTVVLLWMAVIFALSAQPAEQSKGLSEKATEVIIEIIDCVHPLDLEVSTMQEEIMKLNSIVRRYGHGIEYLVLALLVANAFKRSGVRDKSILTLAFVFCALYALSDEIHQIFVPGRACELSDYLTDCLGVIMGMGIYSLSHWVEKSLL